MEKAAARFLHRRVAIREIIGHVLRPDQCEEIAEVYARLVGGDVRAQRISMPPAGRGACGLWHRCNKHADEEFYPPAELEPLLVDALDNADNRLLAAIYRQVMWVQALPGVSADGAWSGLWIYDEMERFRCKRCGKCCTGLPDAYNTVVLETDIARWEEQGRFDILAWIDRKSPIHRAWIDPVTGNHSEACPWLRKIPSRHEFECGIHATKPGHCASYPHTKRHALTTGCRGFDHLVQGLKPKGR
jgi:Fe-S-cluster containining protein